MLDYDLAKDPSVRKGYLDLSKNVLIRAVIDGDIRFFKEKDNIWIDMLNTLSGFEFSGKFFIDTINNNLMNHSGMDVLVILDTFGFRDYSLYSSLWERWYNKKLPHLQEIEKELKETRKHLLEV